MGSDEMVDAPADWNDLWAIVGESLLGGVHHALNNRVAALSAIAQVLGTGMPDAAQLVSSLAGEVGRLDETVSLLSLLRRARTRRPEPVQVPELVATLSPLLGQHNELKEVVFVAPADPGVLPVWAERDLLTQVLLTLMVAAGLEAEWRGCRQVRVAYRGDQDTVSIRVSCETSAVATGEGDPSVRRLDASAAAQALGAMSGELEARPRAGVDTTYEVRLPTLLAARRSAAG